MNNDEYLKDLADRCKDLFVKRAEAKCNWRTENDEYGIVRSVEVTIGDYAPIELPSEIEPEDATWFRGLQDVFNLGFKAGALAALEIAKEEML
jgi:hypothetical protein